MKNILTIAGSDSSSGAGIQADLKTISSLGGYGVCAITAITSQNSLGVRDVEAVNGKTIKKQLEAIFDEIKIDAVKIGMVCNKDILKVIIEKLKDLKPTPIVVDTVMVSSSGFPLLDEEALELMKNELFKIATLITPNLKEAEILSGVKIENIEDMKKAIYKIEANNILLKGGHLKGDPIDILFQKDSKKIDRFVSKRVVFEDVHGTGCTLSSAIATFLSQKNSLFDSVKSAKDYIDGAIKNSFKLAGGSRYIDHFYRIKNG